MKMTLCNIFRDFRGSQDGSTTQEFQAGTQADLSEYLLSCIPKEWAAPAQVEISNKAVIVEPKPSTLKVKR